jgi:hypothetical protein
MRNDPLPFKFVDDDGEANETSAPIIAGHYWGHAIQIDGTFTADVTLQLRLSKSVNYTNVQTVSGPAIIPIGYPVESFQLVIANHVDGQVVAVYAGYKIR